jgi:outer membrane protein
MTGPTRALALSAILVAVLGGSASAQPRGPGAQRRTPGARRSPDAAQSVDAAPRAGSPDAAAAPSIASEGSDVPPPPSEAQPIDLEAFLRGEGRGLTADEVARAAVSTAPSIESSRAQLDVARAGADRALAAFVPRLEITARYTRLSPIAQPNLFGGADIDALLDQSEMLANEVTDPAAQALFRSQIASQRGQASFTFPVILDQWTLGGSLTIPVTDAFLQIWPAYEAADSAVHAQRHQIRARQSEVAQQAREAFYAYARARGALAVARSAVQAAEAQSELIEVMVRAGTTAQVDLIRVQAQVAAARVAALRAEAGVAISAMAVRTIMHAEDTTEIAIAQDLLAGVPPVTESRDSLIRNAIEHRAEMLALRRLIHARSRQVDAAEGSRWPHLVLAGNVLVANPNQRIFPQTEEFRETWDVSAILSWSPNDVFTGERQADEARALRAQVEADMRTLEDGIRMQVTQAYENLRASVAAIEAARTGVEAADETLRVRTEQFRAGATVVTELVLAVTERARAQLDLIGAALDAHVAYSQLQRATGADGPYD